MPLDPRSHARAARLALATLLVPTLLLTACGGSDDTAEESTDDSAGVEVVDARQEMVRTQNLDGDADVEPTDGGGLIMGLEAETDGFNPIVNRWAVSGHYVGSAIFDPLTTIDAEGMSQPYLAESLTPNEDATVWTIKVRDGVTFHDGTPLTSEAVKATFDGHLGSVITSAAIASIESVEIVDDLTVQVNMKEPWVQFPYILSSQVGYVVAPSMVTDLGSSESPVGTGPFVFEVWQRDEQLVTNKNEGYWQEGKPHLDSLEFVPIPDSAERIEALQSGSIDMMITLRAPDIRAMRGDDELKMVEVAFGEEAFLVVNTTQPPFDQRSARLAVAHATELTATWPRPAARASASRLAARTPPAASATERTTPTPPTTSTRHASTSPSTRRPPASPSRSTTRARPTSRTSRPSSPSKPCGRRRGWRSRSPRCPRSSRSSMPPSATSS